MKGFLFFLYPLTWVYRFLFWINQRKITPSRIPSVIVISVGNITVGGTGKTPFVQYLVKYFHKTNKEYAITILSRGYGAKKSNVGAFVPDGRDPDLYGDEPSEHKDRFPDVQVIIGKNRWESFFQHNQIQSPKHIVLLDDGFQHKRIKRDFDIVLLDANAPFGNGFTIPLGFLREPISHLKRANTIVFTKLNEKNKSLFQNGKKEIQKEGITLPIFSSHFQTSVKQIHLDTLGVSKIETPSKLLEHSPNASYFLFTGVGNPKQVLDTACVTFGQNQIRHRFFPDHYPFTESVLFSLLVECKGETIFVTTEKDWVKVRTNSGFLKALKESKSQLVILNIEVVLDEVEKLESMLAGLVSTYEVKNGLVSKTG